MANISDSDSEIFEVEDFLKHRGRGKNVEYLVRWRGFGEEEDSWEPLKNLGDADEALLRYKERSLAPKTPRRVSRGRSDGSGDSVVKSEEVEKSSSESKSGTVTRTVTKTKTVTKTESQNALVSMSESSSPEASPTVTRKSLRSRKTEELKAEANNDSAKETATASSPSRLSSGLHSIVTAPCRMCTCLRLTAKDLPIMVLVTCLMVIASTFYIAGK